MKTIFITCIRGIVSRNILATNVFSELRKRDDLRVVILTAQSQARVLSDEFGGPNVFIEGITLRPLGGMDRLLWVLATNLLTSRTRRVQRRAKFGRDRNLFDYAASYLVGLAGRIRWVRSAFRRVANRFVSRTEFDELFQRYHPQLVFSTDLYEFLDVKLIFAAKQRGIRTVGMVRSWDNVTSKTLLLAIPDHVAVNAERIREELIRYGDVRAELITIVGVPHYDHYLNERERTPRADFLRRFGFDPAKKLILFTPPSDRYLQGDPVAPIILDVLASINAQVLVRLPLVGKSEPEGYRLPPNAVLDAPSNSPDFVNVHLDGKADRHLADSIYTSDLVITWASTMIVDAAVFDKPIILVGFDASPRPYGRSVQQYYDYDHQRRIIATGGCRLVKNREELVRTVREYLNHPERDRDGRAVIRREYCDGLDGKAGERLAKLLLGELGRA